MQFDATGVRELHRVGQKVDQHLPDASRVTQEVGRYVRVDACVQAQAFAVGLGRQHIHGLCRQVANVELARLEGQFACFEARQVQDVVDDVQQRARGPLDMLKVAALRIAQGDRSEQLRVADDRVHRRANFVTHVGEEARLVPRVRHGTLARKIQLDILDLHFFERGLQVVLGAARPRGYSFCRLAERRADAIDVLFKSQQTAKALFAYARRKVRLAVAAQSVLHVVKGLQDGLDGRPRGNRIGRGARKRDQQRNANAAQPDRRRTLAAKRDAHALAVAARGRRHDHVRRANIAGSKQRGAVAIINGDADEGFGDVVTGHLLGQPLCPLLRRHAVERARDQHRTASGGRAVVAAMLADLKKHDEQSGRQRQDEHNQQRAVVERTAGKRSSHLRYDSAVFLSVFADRCGAGMT